MQVTEIRGFQGEYRWLSNFWHSPIRFGDWVFPTAEHAYQASKSLHPIDWQKIIDCPSPGAAKRLGKTMKLRPDWNQVKVENMTEILRAKFQIPELRQKLLDTGEALLIEENTWRDTFWGTYRGKGANMLGLCLVGIRKEIQSTES